MEIYKEGLKQKLKETNKKIHNQLREDYYKLSLKQNLEKLGTDETWVGTSARLDAIIWQSCEELNSVQSKLLETEIYNKLKNTRYKIAKGDLKELFKHTEKEFIQVNKTVSKIESKKQATDELDDRFSDSKLLYHVHKELDKDHKQDDYQKLGTFIICCSAYLPFDRDHVSGAYKGDSSAGKDNLIKTTLSHFPSEDWAFVTRITRSEFEDNINRWKGLALSELNRAEGGANNECIEVYKQAIEGGLRIYKKDNITGKSKEIISEQKTGLFATTETETDDQLETRYIIMEVIGDRIKNKTVVDDTLDKAASEDYFINRINEEESWICKGIRSLDTEIQPIIKFAAKLKEKIPGEEGDAYFFDYLKERVKRDVKRLLALTRAIAWLHQKQREIYEQNGHKFLVVEVVDFLNAIKIFQRFLNISYEGIDPRLKLLIEWVRENQGKYRQEIKDAGFSEIYEDWVLRSEAQKHFNKSRNTIKDWVYQLKNQNLIETYYDNKVSQKHYLIRAPINSPVSNLLGPVSLEAIDRWLTGKMTGKNRYIFEPEDIENPFAEDKKKFFYASSAKIDRSITDRSISPEMCEEKIFDTCDPQELKKTIETNPDKTIEIQEAVELGFSDDDINKWVAEGLFFEEPKGWLRVLE